MARQIVCKKCGASIILYGDEDAHAALVCGCCTEDHHHGQATAQTGVPCRPVTHMYLGPIMTTPAG